MTPQIPRFPDAEQIPLTEKVLDKVCQAAELAGGLALGAAYGAYSGAREAYKEFHNGHFNTDNFKELEDFANDRNT